MSTTHRRDIGNADLTLLAQFGVAIQKFNDQLNNSVICQLGLVIMLLPVWHRTAQGWAFASHKEFCREAIGISKSDMRLICSYLNVREPQMLNTLYRLSMLAVLPGTSPFEKPRFRMPFSGFYSGKLFDQVFVDEGFIIEKRRASGLFRGTEDEKG